MLTMTGHLRKGQNRPALTGRAARRQAVRRQAVRAEARSTAREYGTRVIGHRERAIIANANAGHFLVRDFLQGIGFGEYESAAGRKTAQVYRENHGTDPARGGMVVLRGRIWDVARYDNELDLIAGAHAYKHTAHLVSVPAAVEANIEAAPAADNPQGIQAGDRVSFTISESPNAVSGAVICVYRDAAGILVADIEIRPNNVRLQCVKFLTKLADRPSADKLGLLDRWHNADADLKHHQVEHPVCAFTGQRWGCPDWRALNATMDEVEAQMMNAGMPSPNAEVYAGVDGAERFYADLV